MQCRANRPIAKADADSAAPCDPRAALRPAHRGAELEEIDEVAPGAERAGGITVHAGRVCEVDGEIVANLDERP